ncbi:hypothetical protein RUND412_003571 [Rhizina undulata]
MSGRRGRKQKREEKSDKEKVEATEAEASSQATEQPEEQAPRVKTKAEIAAEKEAIRNAKYDAILRGDVPKKPKAKRGDLPVGNSAPAGAAGSSASVPAPARPQGAVRGAWGGGFAAQAAQTSSQQPAKPPPPPQAKPPPQVKPQPQAKPPMVSASPAPSEPSVMSEPSVPSTRQQTPQQASTEMDQPSQSGYRQPPPLIRDMLYCKKPVVSIPSSLLHVCIANLPSSLANGYLTNCVQKSDQGTTVIVEANYFEVLKLPYEKFFYQHDVSILRKDRPEKDSSPDFNRKIFRHPKVVEILYKYRFAYDGRAQLFTLGNEIPPARVDIEHPDNASIKIMFAIKPVNVKIPVSAIKSFITTMDAKSPSSDAQRALMALEIFFRATPSGNTLNSKEPFITLGRKFFDRDQKGMYLESGIELLEGIFQTLRPGINKLYVNVDLSWNAFWIRDVTFYQLAQQIRQDEKRSTFTRELLTPLIGLKFYQKHQGRGMQGKVSTVHGIENMAPQDYKFTWQHEGKEFSGSIVTYNKQKYNVTLKFPDFPYMIVNNYKRLETDSVTGETSMNQQKAYIPFELAYVKEGQAPKPKKGLTPKQSENMMRQLGKYKPELRKQKIIEIIRRLNWANDDVLKGEIGISTQMTQCKGKLLNPPAVTYNGGKKPQVDKLKGGSWNVLSFKLYEPTTLVNWAVCNLDSKTNNSILQTKVVPELRNAATHLGMGLPVQNPYVQSMNPHLDVRGIRTALAEFYKKACQASKVSPETAAKGTVIIFILPKQPMDVYDTLKKVCHIDIGCHSTVLLAKQVFKFDNQVANNMMLKINPKLGGVNSCLVRTSLDTPLTMHVGVDVTHPGAHAEGMSIAAIVASMDVNCTKYVAHTALQKTKEGLSGGVTSSRAEPVEKMESIMMGFFNLFLARNQGKLPQRVIVWRDGVGESQFDEIIQKEARAVQDACKAAGKSPAATPKLTFCIVQKRHHMRIFPVSQNSKLSPQQDRSGNCAPGIFIENEIVAPNVFNFYGLSHKAFQGTVRPIHYQILIDENGFSYTQLEQLAFNNCYNFSRATTSVSMPAACAYSHLVSKKARSYIHPTSPTLIPLHKNIQYTMWFN